MRIEVIGAGVIGLSTALRLLEHGHQVTVRAAATGERTTSSVAAALWYPYLAAPAEAMRRWGAVSYDVLSSLALSDPAAGVDLRQGFELLDSPREPPDWAGEVRGFRPITSSEGHRHVDGRRAEHGWAFESPVADMAVYLPWLAARVVAAGGRIDAGDRLTPADLRSARPGTQVRVLCTGLGSHELLGDTDVAPVRGQVVLLSQVGLRSWVLDESEPHRPTYVVPRRDVVVCGGTALPNRWDDGVDDETTHDILTRCRALVPELASAHVLGVRVGLRPVRSRVYLERDDTLGPDGLATIACYGHGGAGVTVSWGCAEQVATLVDGTRVSV